MTSQLDDRRSEDGFGMVETLFAIWIFIFVFSAGQSLIEHAQYLAARGGIGDDRNKQIATVITLIRRDALNGIRFNYTDLLSDPVSSTPIQASETKMNILAIRAELSSGDLVGGSYSKIRWNYDANKNQLSRSIEAFEPTSADTAAAEKVIFENIDGFEIQYYDDCELFDPQRLKPTCKIAGIKVDVKSSGLPIEIIVDI